MFSPRDLKPAFTKHVLTKKNVNPKQLFLLKNKCYNPKKKAFTKKVC